MSDRNKPNQESEFAAHIGIDWADQKHFWTMRTADGKLQRGELDNTPEAIQIWAAELERRFDGRPIAVALEQSRGAVIAMLSKYAHLVLFPIHPNTVSNYRKALYPSGAKSDPKDGDLILELLLAHPHKFRRLDPDTVETRKLQFLTEERRKLVNQHTAELQRLLGWLKQMFPQILQWFADPSCAMGGSASVAMADSAGPSEGLTQSAAQILLAAQLPQRGSDTKTAPADPLGCRGY